MLTNMVIKVTSGDLRAQQISVIIFQCGVLHHTECDFLVPEKKLMSSNTLHYFIPKECNLDSKSNNLDYCSSSVGPVMSLSVAFISFA